MRRSKHAAGQNFILSIIVLVILFTPLVSLLIQRAFHIELPPVFRNEEVTYLTGSKSNVDLRAALFSKDCGLLSGELQSDLEAELGNYVPAKAQVMLANAALQEEAIKISSSLFDWKCHPTFYGSSVVCFSEEKFLFQRPLQHSDSFSKNVRQFGEEVENFATRNPEKEIYVVLPDSYQTSSIMPSMQLVTDCVSMDEVVGLMTEEWGTADNLHISKVEYQSIDDFVQNYYHTDLHWNGYGAMDAYDAWLKISDDSALKEAVIPSGAVTAPKFSGFFSRQGLKVVDVPVNEPNLSSFKIDSVEGVEAFFRVPDGLEVMSLNPLNEQYNFYSLWYGKNEDAVITNETVDGSVLIISDSFGMPLRWFYSQTFSTVYNYMDLRTDSGTDIRLGERLAESNAETIVFVGLPLNYSTFSDRHPYYFD